MGKYFWVSKTARHSVFISRDHSVLHRLAADYNVDIVISGPDDMATQAYVQAVDDAVNQQASGIMIIGWGDKAIIPAVDAAVKRGIPVITIDCDIPGSKRLAYAGTDWFHMGGAMADDLATRVMGRGKVLMLGMSGRDNNQAGFLGFQNRIKAYSGVEIVGLEDDTDIRPDRARAIVADYLGRIPDLAGIAAFDGYGGLGSAMALEAAGKAGSVKLICAESDAPHKNYLQSGVIDSLFAQKREAFTNLAFQMLFTYNHGSAATKYLPGSINIPGNIDTGYIVVTRDNLPHLDIEFSLDDSVKYHRLTQELALVSGMVESDMQPGLTTDLDSRIVYANPAAERSLALGRERWGEVMLKDIFDLTEEQQAQMKRCLNDGMPISFETTITGNDKIVLRYRVNASPLINEGKIRGLALSAADITLKKKDEDLLWRERHLNEQIMEISPTGITLVNRDGRIVFANAVTERVLGLTKDTITARTYNAPDWRITDYDGNPFPDDQLPFQQVKATGQPVRDVRHAIERPDGSRVLLSINASPLFDDTGEFDGMVAIVDDVTDKVLAELELQESEEKYRQLFGSNIDAIVLVDTDTRRIVDVNDMACLLYGYSRDEMLDLTVIEISAEPEESAASIEKVIALGSNTIALRYHRRKDGTVFPVEISSGVFYWKGKRIVCGILRDISRRTQMENDLRESEEKYSHLFHHLSDAVIVHDLDRRIVDFNNKALELFGYSGDEMTGLDLERLHPSGEYETSGSAFADIDRRKIFNYETQYVKKDGEIFWADVTLSLLTIGSERVVQKIIRDISERRQAEAQLHMLSSMVKQSTEGIVLVNLGGFVQYANQAFAEMHGYEPEELIGKQLSIFHTPEQMPAVEEVNRQIFRTGHFYGEVWHARRDGTVFPSMMNNTVVRDGEGKPVGIMGMMRDVTRRKQAEEALRASEERFHLLADAAEEGIVIHDGGLIIDANKALARMFGYELSELIGISAKELATPESWEIMKSNILSGHDRPYECVGIRKDGSNIYCMMVGKPYKYRDRMLRVAVIRDITDRKLAEAALRESEERFRVAFQTSPDAVTISEISTGKYVDVNEGFEQISGYRRNEAVGRTSIELNIWLEPSHREDFISQIKKNGFIKNVEFKLRSRDGTVRTCLLSANIIVLNGEKYLLTAVRNIESLIQAQEAMRKSEERFRTIFETAQDAIFIKDRDLKYLAVNPSMAALLGVAPEELVGKTYEEFWEPEGADHNREMERRVLEGDILSEESSKVIKGELRTFHIITVPIRDAADNITGLCGIARDITETRRLRDLADRAKRLEAAGRIAGQVAHDFNNLLGPLIAYPGLMREELPEDHPAVEYLNDIEHAAEQMADINQQLLTLGRRGHYNLEPININDVITRVLDKLPANADISVKSELSADLMNINAGVAQIHRVISNLVTNALDAMPKGGRLTVRTENYYVNRDTGFFNQIPRGEYVKVSIQDTGEGIPPDIISNIFDPFFTTKTADKKRGSGLGLSIVHAVVEDHNGRIDFHSQPGHGASFYLYFPITRKTTGETIVESTVGGNETILIVDDDPVQREVTSRLLAKMGYRVHLVENGEAAIKQLAAGHRYDLLILDMVMEPGIDGAETFRRALEINPGQKALIFSGFAESERVKEALMLGAGAFLKKPLTLGSITAAVRKELDRKVRRAARK